MNTNRTRINILAVGARLPTMHSLREYVEAGGLMSYGPSLPDLFRRAADMVDRILRGARPAEIPIRAGDQIRSDHQSHYCQGAWPDDPRVLPAARRRGDRVIALFAVVHWSACGTKRTSRNCPLFVRFRGEADIPPRSGACRSDANDPKRTNGRLKFRSAAVPRVLFLLFGSTGGTGQ